MVESRCRFCFSFYTNKKLRLTPVMAISIKYKDARDSVCVCGRSGQMFLNKNFLYTLDLCMP